MDKKAMIAEQTKNALRQSFLEIYSDTGMSGMTVSDITRKAGYNRCTFYNHYNDIPELLSDIENSVLSAINEKANSYISAINLEHFSINVEHILYIFENHVDTIYILLSKSGNTGFRRRLKDTILNFYCQVFSKKFDPDKIEYLMSYAVSAAIGLIEHWYESGKEYSSEEFITLAQSLVFHGIFGQLQEG